jgi:hypothetical protein
MLRRCFKCRSGLCFTLWVEDVRLRIFRENQLGGFSEAFASSLKMSVRQTAAVEFFSQVNAPLFLVRLLECHARSWVRNIMER